MRTSTQSIINSLSADAVRLGVLVHLDFANDPVRFWTGNSDIVFGGQTYVAVSDLINIGSLSEDLGARPNSLTLTMAIPDDADIELILNQQWQGRKAYIYIATFDENWSMIGAPFLTAKYSIDAMPMQVGKNNQVSVRLTSEMSDWDRPTVARYTHEYQQYRFAGDLGLQFVHETVDREINWGVPGGGAAVSNRGGGTNGGRNTHSRRYMMK